MIDKTWPPRCPQCGGKFKKVTEEDTDTSGREYIFIIYSCKSCGWAHSAKFLKVQF